MECLTGQCCDRGGRWWTALFHSHQAACDIWPAMLSADFYCLLPVSPSCVAGSLAALAGSPGVRVASLLVERPLVSNATTISSKSKCEPEDSDLQRNWPWSAT